LPAPAGGRTRSLAPDRIDLAEGDTVALDAHGHTLRWTGRVGSDPAGIRFDHGPLAPLAQPPGFELRVVVDGQALPAPAIYLSDAAGHPASAPFAYRRVAIFGQEREDPALLASAAPSLSPARPEPVRVYIGRLPDDRTAAPPPALDQAARQRLRALGYVE